MYLSDIYTISANLAGIAGMSIPCGFTKDRLPIGLQILAPGFAEEKMLRVARMYRARNGLAYAQAAVGCGNHVSAPLSGVYLEHAAQASKRHLLALEPGQFLQNRVRERLCLILVARR